MLRRLICHRERSAAISLVIARSVAISVIQGWPSRKERLLRRLICHRERSAAISLVIASAIFCQSPLAGLRAQRGNLGCHCECYFLSLRGTKQSLLFVIAGTSCQSPLAGLRAQRGDLSCHREERGDLGCSGLANSQKRDCFVSRNDSSVVSSRGAWRSRL